jgi:tripartite-type tricarboxylate transporter receptor subunit TctC
MHPYDIEAASAAPARGQRTPALLAAALGLLAGIAVPPAAAAAEAWPTHTISLVVPFAPGGGADTLARLIAPGMSQELGQSIVIENKPGASGQIGEAYIANSKPDGYNIMLSSSSMVTNQYLYPHQPFDVNTAFIPIGVIARFRMIAVVNPGFAARNVNELVQIARDKPGQVMFATGGVGSAMDLAGHMFMTATGVKMGAVPYKGGAPAMIDVVGGRVPLVFGDGSSAITTVRSGTVRAIAITGQERSALLPDVPTFKEQGIDLDLYEWNALYAPAGTPPEVLARLRGALFKAMGTPAVARRLADLGAEPVPGGAEAAVQFINAQSQAVQKIVKDAGMRGVEEK